MRISNFLLMSALSLFAATVDNAYAAQQSTVRASEQKSDWTIKAQEWLKAQGAVTGKFTQINDDGTETGGTFAMMRPGKLRFDYKNPDLHVVANDGKLVYQDPTIDQITTMPLARTPLSILLDDESAWNKRVKINNVTQTNNQIDMNLSRKDDETGGEITLEFSKNPFALIGWETVDYQNKRTRVSLSDLKAHAHLSAKQFQLPQEEN